MALIFVGALNVGTINTIWSGDIRPRKHGVAETLDIRKVGDARAFSKGDTLGWFNMGSTVILLLPPGGAEGFGDLHTGAAVRVGQAIGRTGGAADASQ
jgi:phosphatidylserine decarboxylase